MFRTVLIWIGCMFLVIALACMYNTCSMANDLAKHPQTWGEWLTFNTQRQQCFRENAMATILFLGLTLSCTYLVLDYMKITNFYYSVGTHVRRCYGAAKAKVKSLLFRRRVEQLNQKLRAT